MKKLTALLFLTLTLCLLASCERDADLSKLDKNLIVLTKYDTSFDFKAEAQQADGKTFYVSDTILNLNSQGLNPFWCNGLSKQITEQIRNQFAAIGYTQAANARDARYIVAVTAVEDMQTVLSTYQPYWCFYWRGWYSSWWNNEAYYPFYPYSTGYHYETGTVLVQMIDMQPVAGEGYPIRWSATLGGMLNTVNEQFYKQEAIDEAFSQSASYLKVN